MHCLFRHWYWVGCEFHHVVDGGQQQGGQEEDWMIDVRIDTTQLARARR